MGLTGDRTDSDLCLCPNDHVRFEYGSIYIEEDLTIVDRFNGGTIGTLRTVSGHTIDAGQLAYHREHFDLTT